MEAVQGAGSERPRVLVVCTGNLARSAMAQFLLEERLGDRSRIESAGTRAEEGRPMAEHARAALEEVGVTPGEFGSRRLTAEMIQDAVLVLTATREHRAEVLREVPIALRRTFTLREFARLIEQDDRDSVAATSVAELATRTAAMRGRLPAPQGSDDIDDPYGRSLRDYRACRDQIAQAVHAITPALVRVGL